MDKGSEVAARFDRVAGQWDANPARVALAKAVGEAIRIAVPLRADMAVMDFGAGTGLLTVALLPFVGSVTAVDASGEMLRVLEGKLAGLGVANVRTVRADVSRDDLPATTFDAVVSSMALHHVADVPAALVRLRGSLRPGGWIALADLDAEDGSFHPDPTGVYHRGFERRGLCAWLERAGFAGATAATAHTIERDGRRYGIFLATARAGE